MFERKTVFIVGAGGSHELGLPLGSQLSATIADKLNFRFGGEIGLQSGDPDIAQAIKVLSQRTAGRDRTPYFEAGRAIARGMPQALSIDNYLHTHSKNRYVVEVGKLAIAQSILEAERSCPLYCGDSRFQAVDFKTLKSTWHTSFFKMLHEGAVLPNDLERLFENVTIITFNYDRCIEHYLEQSLRNYFLIQPQRAQELANRLRVIHPYGRVGKLPWQAGNGLNVEFGADAAYLDLGNVASHIRTFTEGVEDDDIQSAMHSVIAEAEMLVYLGFSFGDINMRQMALHGRAKQRHIVGTSLGISEANRRVIENVVIESMGPERPVATSINLPCVGCDQLLMDYWRFILTA